MLPTNSNGYWPAKVDLIAAIVSGSSINLSNTPGLDSSCCTFFVPAKCQSILGHTADWDCSAINLKFQHWKANNQRFQSVLSKNPEMDANFILPILLYRTISGQISWNPEIFWRLASLNNRGCRSFHAWRNNISELQLVSDLDQSLFTHMFCWPQDIFVIHTTENCHLWNVECGMVHVLTVLNGIYSSRMYGQYDVKLTTSIRINSIDQSFLHSFHSPKVSFIIPPLFCSPKPKSSPILYLLHSCTLPTFCC